MSVKPITTKKSRKKKPHAAQSIRLVPEPQGRSRHEALEAVLRRLYHSMSSEEIEDQETSFAHAHMEMYTIESFNENGVELKDFTNDEIVAPVIFPMEVLELLRPGDLFLFTIGYAERRWYVIWMSGLYQ